MKTFGTRTPTWRVAALLFGSGCCALIYQIGWLREFRLIFGASTAASAAVLAIFIGGLGLGGLVLGPRADRHPRPILFYAQLELIVALSAAASPLLLALVTKLYIGIGGTPRLGLAAGTIVRLISSALVLAVPTIVMGGTLPAAARGVTRRGDARRQDVAALYGLNTLGAVLGCVAATFYLLEIFGTRTTLWLAAAINVLVAMLARQLDRSMESEAGETGTEVGPTSADSRPLSPVDPSAPVWFVLLASGVVGFAFFLMELVWYRMLGPLLGGSVFTFGLILAVALAGIGVGGLVYALLGSDRPASLGGFATSCLLEAIGVAAGYALGDRLALLSFVLAPLGQVTFGAHIIGWTIVAAIVVFPPALVAGYQFPLLVALYGRGRDQVGKQLGLVYAANTLGAIVGSLAGGFGVLPWLSAPGAWRIVALALVTLGLGAMGLAVGRGTPRRWIPQLALAGVAFALLAALGPTAVWRHSGIGAGRAALTTIGSPNQLRNWSELMRRVIAWEGDGTESSVALLVQPSGYAFIVNGKSDGSARGDAPTQVMLGLLGAIVNPEARRSLVIGLGTGSSAGWLGAIPSMERVDVVELEPLVVDVARACELVNRDVLLNPKVHLAIGDARERLLAGADRYDVIASEPSNPFRAGIASLFTREYYQAASDRLNAAGVFVQWLQAYEVDARTLRTVYATMGAVFPHVETWQLGRGDLALVAAKRPLTYQVRVLAARIAEEPFATALRAVWRATDVHGLLAHYLAGDGVTRALASALGTEINTDDRNVVEFGFARSVGRPGVLIVSDLRRLAQSMGVGWPPVAEGDAVAWASVETAWVGFHASEGSSPDMLSALRPDLRGDPQEDGRRLALVDYYQDGNLVAARQHWPAEAVPRDPSELTMVADVVADTGSDDAIVLIERLRRDDPGGADTMLAELRARQNRFDEASNALASAFDYFRRSPWTQPRIKAKAMELAIPVATRSPAAARRLFAALDHPFALRALDDDRLKTRALLTALVDFKGMCAPALRALEPHVPWEQRFLALRRDCYAASGAGDLSAATRDLVAFLSREPAPLAAGISPAAPVR